MQGDPVQTVPAQRAAHHHGVRLAGVGDVLDLRTLRPVPHPDDPAHVRPAGLPQLVEDRAHRPRPPEVDGAGVVEHPHRDRLPERARRQLPGPAVPGGALQEHDPGRVHRSGPQQPGVGRPTGVPPDPGRVGDQPGVAGERAAGRPGKQAGGRRGRVGGHRQRPGQPGERGGDGQRARHGQHDRGRGQDCGPALPADPGPDRRHRVGRGRQRPVRVAQGAGQQVLDVGHRSSPSAAGRPASVTLMARPAAPGRRTRVRSRASPLAACDFTVPGAMSRTRAISASGRSS
ncbi:MAG: hypothetical protein AVDCRST_MAG41-2013 [uncultured Corynebacteriales bacterium]|uniref:Uncharacterized protein n=1 Tax=uncultured Mycobacteriales bacterium TaxID=581187 RepID=A0A6J4IDN8_9ACTN|nr:MAG: hypothetical protein AVDCRST_MAG41-2013 [uncultured Corynebacteriales bacterium]